MAPNKAQIGKNKKERTHPVKKVIRIGSKRKPKVPPQDMALTSYLTPKVELIQALIPIGLGAVVDDLKQKVEQLAGIKDSRQDGSPGHYRLHGWLRKVNFQWS